MKLYTASILYKAKKVLLIEISDIKSETYSDPDYKNSLLSRLKSDLTDLNNDIVVLEQINELERKIDELKS